jgi:hypothetical protein
MGCFTISLDGSPRCDADLRSRRHRAVLERCSEAATGASDGSDPTVVQQVGTPTTLAGADVVVMGD